MGQNSRKTQSSSKARFYRIAFIKAKSHGTIVDQCYEFCKKTLESETNNKCSLDVYDVPGALEIPLLAQDIASTGKYDAIIASAFIVDGGIYRHDFVAGTVLDAMMRVGLDTGMAIFSAVLTPHQYQKTEVHDKFFCEHFQCKGEEAAHACLEMFAARQAVANAT
ncbi:MAG: 6,7-dimethyl-8-ribityllumazine synthase [Robiginitomaculum sp.]